MNLLESLEEIYTYCEQHSEAESPLLQSLVRDTHLKTLAPRMLSGHLQGRFLSFISKLIQPKRILEIGTFTGYAMLCLAESLKNDSLLYTIEGNDELAPLIKKYIEQSPYKNNIQLLVGDALTILPKITDTFDLVFIDAAKREYAQYYDIIFEKVKIGGVIIADNVLWSGKVLDEKKDTDTQIIDDFNKKLANDIRVEALLLPLRDGLMMVRKISS